MFLWKRERGGGEEETFRNKGIQFFERNDSPRRKYCKLLIAGWKIGYRTSWSNICIKIERVTQDHIFGWKSINRPVWKISVQRFKSLRQRNYVNSLITQKLRNRFIWIGTYYTFLVPKLFLSLFPSLFFPPPPSGYICSHFEARVSFFSLSVKIRNFLIVVKYGFIIYRRKIIALHSDFQHMRLRMCSILCVEIIFL